MANDTLGHQGLYNQAWQCIEWDIYDGALFAAERLVSLTPCPDAKHVHASALYHLGRYKSALEVAAGQQHPGCIYVYAQCCLKLDKYTDGTDALETVKSIWSRPSPSQSLGSDPSGLTPKDPPSPGAFYLLLGKLYQAAGNINQAAHSLALSAKENPYLWENVDNLVTLPGYDVKISSIFPTASSDDTAAGPASENNVPSFDTTDPKIGPDTSIDPFSTPIMPPPTIPTTQIQDSSVSFGAPPTIGATPFNIGARRNITPSPINGRNNSGAGVLPATPMRKRPPQRRMFLGDLSFTPRPKLESTPNKPVNTRVVSRPGVGAGAGASAAGIIATASSSPMVVQLYSQFANIKKYLARYQSRQALQEIENLSPEHQDSPTVLALVAKAHFQLMDLKKSSMFFEKLRVADPFRVEDMDDYSKVLWQLRKEIDLAYLGHAMTSVDKKAWQTWCVMGNSFSLQQDTSHAIESFQRAVQLEPKCSVAYALQGHEYMANEEGQNAKDAFRLALRYDNTNYSAWYGLALVSLRFGDIDQAEQLVTQALRINPNNAVLISFMGTVLEKRGQYSLALAQYRRACSVQPDSAISRFKLGEALIEAGMYSEALEELQYLRKLAPNDASVHFVMGRVYRMLKNYDQAVTFLTIALNLEPRALQHIKPELDAVAAQDSELGRGHEGEISQHSELLGRHI